jgi:glucokinase
VILAGDIGGTKTNMALYSVEREHPSTVVVERFETGEHSGAEEIIEKFMRNLTSEIDSVCLAVAGPVAEGESRLTNLPWTISEKRLRERFGWRHVKLINDVEATAHELPFLKKEEKAVLMDNPAHPSANMGILAPGTGLGSSLVLQRQGGVVPVASEAGHTDFAPVCEEDRSLWQFIYDKQGWVSQEMILSGSGLYRLYQWRRYVAGRPSSKKLDEEIEKKDDPAALISVHGLHQTDKLCMEALDSFARILGSVAGNLALIWMTRGGIYLAGGISPKILPKLQQPVFSDAFVKKGRFTDFLKSIPVYVILDESAPIIGAARVAWHALAVS